MDGPTPADRATATAQTTPDADENEDVEIVDEAQEEIEEEDEVEDEFQEVIAKKRRTRSNTVSPQRPQQPPTKNAKLVVERRRMSTRSRSRAISVVPYSQTPSECTPSAPQRTAPNSFAALEEVEETADIEIDPTLPELDYEDTPAPSGTDEPSHPRQAEENDTVEIDPELSELDYEESPAPSGADEPHDTQQE